MKVSRTSFGALVANTEFNNTLIIYTSDNGFFNGEHRLVNASNGTSTRSRSGCRS